MRPPWRRLSWTLATLLGGAVLAACWYAVSHYRPDPDSNETLPVSSPQGVTRVAVLRVHRAGQLICYDHHGAELSAAADAKDLLELRGTPVGREELVAACRLAGLLRLERESLRLVSLEIGADPLDRDLRLRTAGGTLVIWQRLAVVRSDEVSDETKLGWLRKYRQQHGSLERPDGPYLLDLRHATGIVRRRLNP